jgi:hypothetical protein
MPFLEYWDYRPDVITYDLESDSFTIAMYYEDQDGKMQMDTKTISVDSMVRDVERRIRRF